MVNDNAQDDGAYEVERMCGITLEKPRKKRCWEITEHKLG